MADSDAPKSGTALEIDDTVFETALTGKFAKRRPYVPHDPRKILCFLPAVVRQIRVRPGQKIRRGEHILVLEAMKMENEISSPVEGKVKAVHCQIGQMVSKGQLLIELE
jgi:biotin carboxyl carrier protein